MENTPAKSEQQPQPSFHFNFIISGLSIFITERAHCFGLPVFFSPWDFSFPPQHNQWTVPWTHSQAVTEFQANSHLHSGNLFVSLKQPVVCSAYSHLQFSLIASASTKYSDILLKTLVVPAFLHHREVLVSLE